jgi:glucose uptake protein GlcU
MRAANLALKFLLELAALASFGYAAYVATPNGLLAAAVAVLAPLAGAAIWGIFAAPKSTRRLRDPALLIFETLFFAAAALALLYTGDLNGGIVLFALFVVNAALLRALPAQS